MRPELTRFVVPVLAIAGLFVMVLWMAGYFDTKVTPGIATNPALPDADWIKVVRRIETVYETVPASIEAKQATTISPRILARIEKVHVRAGSLVTQGQLLIELEKSDLQSRVNQAQSQVNSVAARLAEAKLGLDRAADLIGKKLIAQSDMDRAQANHDALVADHLNALQALDEATSALAFASITAPIAGRIVDRFAEPGDTAQPGKSLLSLYNPSSLRVEANVREQLAVSLNEGMVIEVSIPSKNLVLESSLEEMVPAGNVGSRSFMVKTRLNAVEGLLPGMYAQLKIPAGQQLQLVIPKSSIQVIGQLEIVSVKSAGQIEKRYIRTGKHLEEDMVEVISGLEEGEAVMSGTHK
jgi:RND family efflux transporter MFP subunit